MSEDLLNNSDDIKLNESQEIQQILGRPPGWLLRWGISIVLLGTIFILLISYFVRYPDKIAAPVQILTENPPIRLVARADGKIAQLLVSDQEKVQAGQLLGVLENTAHWEDVLLLDEFLTTIPDNYSALKKMQLPTNLKLGSLQTSFSTISQQLEDYKIFIAQNISTQKRNSLDLQIQQFEALNTSLRTQKNTAQELVDIASKDVERKKNLYAAGTVAEIEIEAAQTQYFQAKRQLEAIDVGIINNNIKIEELRIQGLEIQQNNNQSDNSQLLSVQENLRRLKSEVLAWKRQFLLEASIEGKVSMDRVWSSQQFVQTNQEILTIVPEKQSSKLIGKAMLPLNRSGKVKANMEVNIRLDGYPYQEFGTIEASVKNISLVPTEGAYMLELNIPEKLETTYGKTIPFQQEMTGVANIITEDRRIIDRVFDKVLSILKNR